MAVTLAALSSCDLISRFIHDDEVVAELGKNRLYRSQLDAYVPKGMAPEDSEAVARQFINLWAKELLFMDVAQAQLSKQESDVTKELEDYRRSLLKFRYEQRFLSERLDTAVTRQEIESYYEGHKELFKLEVPVVKARFLDIMPDSPNLKLIKSKMSSSEYDSLVAADSLAYISAIRYEDRSDEWVSMTDFAKNFGLDYGTVLSKLRPDGFIEIPDEKGDLKVAYVTSMLKPGMVAPVDYYQNKIKDIIISSRKRELLSTLEQDLLEDALAKETLIIY